MAVLSDEIQRAVLEKVERIYAELEGLHELGLGFVLAMALDDWATVDPGLLSAFTVSSIAPPERAELLEHIANEIRLGRDMNVGGPPS